MPKDHTRPQNLRFIEKLNKILPGAQKVLNRFCENYKPFLEILEKYRERFEARSIYMKCYIQSTAGKLSISVELVHKTRSSIDTNFPVNRGGKPKLK
ncbi:hypothetical protein QTP88_002575 [Uroleucon formosanum]